MFSNLIRHCGRVVGLYLICVGSSSAISAESLCFTGETETFSCMIGQKTVSICEKDSEHFSYRYGTRDNLELNILSGLSFSTMGFSGGYESRLTFNNGKYEYVVFTAMYSLGPTNLNKDMQSGVIVAKDGAKIDRKRCTNPIHADFQLGQTAAKIYADVEGNQKRFVEY
jgi:hypothetical protein